MVFGGKKAQPEMCSSRLAAVAGAPAPAGVATTGGAVDAAPRVRIRGEIQPDPSRMRPRQIEETPEDRKRRLAAKAVNFSATIIARIIIIAGAGLWVWQTYQTTGQIHRGAAIGLFIMSADLGRVIMKASEHGTK